MGFGSRLDSWRMSTRNDVSKYAWTIILAILKETGEIALQEFAAALEQYRKERKTPDGWTEEEYLTYAIGRLKLIQSREIGPFFVDEILDWGIERLVDVLNKKLDNLDADPGIDDDGDLEPPVEPPPAPAPVVDPYYPTKYGPDAPIPYNKLRAGDKVYKKGLDRFVIPGRFSEHAFYVGAVQGADLIDVVEADGADVT